ncbi:5-(carboxyamino)imidazole ribonucleotide mutase [Acetomicrobium sp. S15 = DSM 107314]|uniref:5-(carboxyamino)imidazole ribonucleotide mutase n=1 Tax=Acetomicrobium sp. S15 = DSM 107314 TaxID=2529858 RepID=UPI0018E17FAD|nr:5-(carboxyamino)imidazole ribonucleotide mutase [Acetomicrobium sp. S15 = DSM 107314]
MSAKVGIVIGSKSDLERGKEAAKLLEELAIPYEITIASAHRTPDDVASYAKRAAERGIGVIIAMAGLAAALPGAIAAYTLIPVIGVPLEAGALKGVDALLSVAQMPPGVPVAAVGIGGVKNAVLMAARILSLSDGALRERLNSYVARASGDVQSARSSLEGLPAAPDEAFD